MSSYAELTLGSLNISSSRNSVDDFIWLFRPSDKHIERIDRRNRERLANYVMDEYIDEYDENNPFSCVEYRCTASEARDRLDLKGFTYEVAEASFKAGLKHEIQELEDKISGKGLFKVPMFVRSMYANELMVLRSLTIKSWLKVLERIRVDGLTKESLDGLPSTDAQLPLLRYMLGTTWGYGFPGDDSLYGDDNDFWNFIRLAVQAVPPQEQLIYDLTSLVTGGWIAEGDEQVSLAENLLYVDLQLGQKVIVLTEGDVDRRILERSLKLLHPHLSDYFHFFKFTSNKKIGGGAGELANLLRAFVAADVRHRILALFDNDTAAKASLSTLDSDSLPGNIAVCHYPNIALATDYPTLGPSGEERMDVNGLAGSIELYLGQGVLRNAKGILSPVQWTSYERKLGAYQGVVLDKGRIQKDFFKKLVLCEEHPDEIDSYDWEGIRAILNTMRTAFHDVDAEAILSGKISE